eukprot:TRINITY_DN4248_c0_g1_i1.p1 TRINITY_DN4248_c0_g1~~TRINITY_DN4248_c0_g1_i1.p1  ORF type:complete len:1192 (-),score=368.09 TRINITY_DN4248_c0_g1_i1:43-3618(-)
MNDNSTFSKAGSTSPTVRRTTSKNTLKYSLSSSTSSTGSEPGSPSFDGSPQMTRKGSISPSMLLGNPGFLDELQGDSNRRSYSISERETSSSSFTPQPLIGKKEERTRALRAFSLTKKSSTAGLLSVDPEKEDREDKGASLPGGDVSADAPFSKEPLKVKKTKSKGSIRKFFSKTRSGEKYAADLKEETGMELTETLKEFSVLIEKEPLKWLYNFLEHKGFASLVNFVGEQPNSDSPVHDLLIRKLALTCMRVTLTRTENYDLKQILSIKGTKSEALSAVIKNLSYEELQPYVLHVLNEFNTFPKGYTFIFEALQEYATLKGKSNKFEVLTSILRLTHNSAVSFCLCLISSILNEIDDDAVRNEMRERLLELELNTILADLKSNTDPDVRSQLEILEQTLDDLRLESQDKIVNISDYPEFGTSSKNLAKVSLLLAKTFDCIVPYEETTTGKKLMELVSEVITINPDSFSLHRQDSEPLIDTEVTLGELGIKGEVNFDMKFKPWTLKVKFESHVESIQMDPYSTVAEGVAKFLKEFPTGQDEEYGLFVKKKVDKEWLQREAKLVTYQQMLEECNFEVEFAIRPRMITVSFADDRQPSTVEADPSWSVKAFLSEIYLRKNSNDKEGKDHKGGERIVEYGLCLMNPGMLPVWLESDKRLSQYSITPRSKLQFSFKPKPLAIHVCTAEAISPEGTPSPSSNVVLKEMESPPVLDLVWNKLTSEVITEILEKLQLEGTAVEWVIQYVPAGGKPVSLIPWVNLNQQIEYNTNHVFLKRTTEQIQSEQDSINVWDENDPKPVLTTTEGGFTLNELIIQLTSESEQGFDMSYVDTFLSTFESFTTQETLFKKLMERFRIPERCELPEEKRNLIRMRVCTCLHHWISRSQEMDAEVMAQISQCIEREIASHEELKIRDRLKTKIENKIANRNKGRPFLFRDPPPEPILPKHMDEGLSIFNVDPMEIARQLTLQTWEQWSKIQPIEFFNQAWSKPKLQHLAPNIISMINSFNSFAAWVSTAIVSEKKIKKRVKVFVYIIKVAEALRDLKNFHMLTATVSGFNNSSVLRLKWTREQLPKKTETVLQQLEQLTSMDSSFKWARLAVDKSVPPCIPYIGTYLTDLTFIDETADFVSPGRINFEKRKLVYKVLLKIETKQQEGYNLKKVDAISDLIDRATRLDDGKLYENSLECEPRNATKASLQ